MNIEAKRTRAFTPFEITFKIETIEEAQKFYALFNTIPVCDFLGRNEFKTESVRRLIAEHSGVQETILDDETPKLINCMELS